MKNPKINARAASKEFLAPLIKAGRRNPALYPKMAEAMTELEGGKTHRQSVANWLHENEEKRVEPQLGTGLLLRKVGKVVIKAIKSKGKTESLGNKKLAQGKGKA